MKPYPENFCLPIQIKIINIIYIAAEPVARYDYHHNVTLTLSEIYHLSDLPVTLQ